MIIQKSAIEKMIDQADRKAERAYMNYQETGAQRYAREQEKAEDLADTLRMALSAYAELITLGTDAHKALTDGDQAAEEQILCRLISVAKIYTGLYIEELAAE